MKYVLYNQYSDNCCAYCKHHHCSMTPQQMKKKECLKKQCHHFVKDEKHPIWKQREAEKKKKKENKKKKKEKIKALTTPNYSVELRSDSV